MRNSSKIQNFFLDGERLTSFCFIFSFLGVMTVLIFPKLFEFFKFLSSLFENPNVVVLDIKQKDECEFVVTVLRRHHFEQDGYYSFRILLINDSDINFYGIFSKMLVNKTEGGGASCLLALVTC